MKAVISSTHDDKYLFFLPIVTWLWNKLGVDVICFLPERGGRGKVLDKAVILESNEKSFRITEPKLSLVLETCCDKNISFSFFKSPAHKEATYAQCSRLYAACLDLPEDEVLITGDCDMGVFSGIVNVKDAVNNDEYLKNMMTIVGSDLVPDGQVPVCYTWGTVEQWRKAFIYIYGKGHYDTDGVKTYQQYLDLLLGDIETDNFRGNYWSKDQEELFNIFSKTAHVKIPRARHGTQFADYRVDRDDVNWRSYVNEDLIDAHLWRPGYTDENFANIMELLTMKYPDENFQWLVDYTNKYKKLL